MTQEQRSRQTQQKILEAAQVLFSTRGFDQSGIDDICRQAGITKGAFYHHYSSKQQLLVELFNHWIDEVAQKINPQMLQSDNALELLLRVMESMEPAFARAKGQLPIFVDLYIKGLNDQQLKKVNQQSYQKFLDFFSGIAQEGIQEGTITADDAQEVAKILFSLTIGFMVQGLLNPRGADWSALTKKSIKMLLD